MAVANHRTFLLFLILTGAMLVACLHGHKLPTLAFLLMDSAGMATFLSGCPCACPASLSWSACLVRLASCHPSVVAMAATMFWTLFWISVLISQQLYQVGQQAIVASRLLFVGLGQNHCVRCAQVGCLAMTTNERVNAARYPHLHTGRKGRYAAPWNRGVAANMLEFFGLTRSSTDWATVFDISKLDKQEHCRKKNCSHC